MKSGVSIQEEGVCTHQCLYGRKQARTGMHAAAPSPLTNFLTASKYQGIRIDSCGLDDRVDYI